MKKVVAILVSMLIMLCALPAFAQEDASWYSVENGKLSISLTGNGDARWQPFMSGDITMDSQMSDSDGAYDLKVIGYDGGEAEKSAQIVMSLTSAWDAEPEEMRALELTVDTDGQISVVSARTADFNDLREFYNPKHYELMRITAAAFMDDGRVCIQAGLGSMDDEEGRAAFNRQFVLWLAPGCEVLLPDDISNTSELDECDDASDLVEWFYESYMAAGGDDSFAFYATFAMNEAGQLRSIVYSDVK